MTFIEKNTVLAALAHYKKEMLRKADQMRKNGEPRKAQEYQTQANISNALIFTFSEILSEPCGTVKI